jgi:hypothetical protein
MKMPSWDAVRTPVAFVVAPLSYPLIVVLYTTFVDPFPPDDPTSKYWLVTFLYFSTIAVYVSIVALGIPIYLLMCEHGWTSFWLAPLVGYVGGAACTFLVGMPRPFELGIPTTALTMYGPIGAVICTIIWLIARPDRRSPAVAQGDVSK